MTAAAPADGSVVVHHLLAQGERGQGDGRFEVPHLRWAIEQRQLGIGKATHGPQHVAARESQRGEGIGAGQRDDLALGKTGTPPQIGWIAIRLGATLDQEFGLFFAKARDLAQAETQGAPVVETGL